MTKHRIALPFLLAFTFSLSLSLPAWAQAPADLQVTLDDEALAGLASGAGAFARVSVDVDGDGEVISGVIHVVAAAAGVKDVSGAIAVGRGCVDDKESIAGSIMGTLTVPALSKGGVTTGNINVTVGRSADGVCLDEADESVVSVNVETGASSKLVGALGATTGGRVIIITCTCICTFNRWGIPICRCDGRC